MLGKPLDPQPLAPWPIVPHGCMILNPKYGSFFDGFHDDDPVNGAVRFCDGFVNLCLAFDNDAARIAIQQLIARGHFCMIVSRKGYIKNTDGSVTFSAIYSGMSQ